MARAFLTVLSCTAVALSLSDLQSPLATVHNRAADSAATSPDGPGGIHVAVGSTARGQTNNPVHTKKKALS